jgi:4-diphosphocytidyl-2-C-methyl-D-erythritol kinase
MLRFPNCKINLGLYVTGRRPDGYHDLETVFYPIQVQDTLEIVSAAITTLHLSGLEVIGDKEDNLVWKAYYMLQTAFPAAVPPMDIYINKTIPMGAGLGGGSADGAFMLQLVNDYCNLGLDKKALAEMALQLGSDCPYFIYNTPMHATGRGENLQPLELNLKGYSIQLICPQVHVSTATAFKMITPKPVPVDLQQLANIPIAEWKHKISNDFETSVFAQHPVLASIKQQIYDGGALYAAMSGSGSAVYGIFEKEGKAEVKVDVEVKEFVTDL